MSRLQNPAGDKLAELERIWVGTYTLMTLRFLVDNCWLTECHRYVYYPVENHDSYLISKLLNTQLRTFVVAVILEVEIKAAWQFGSEVRIDSFLQDIIQHRYRFGLNNIV